MPINALLKSPHQFSTAFVDASVSHMCETPSPVFVEESADFIMNFYYAIAGIMFNFIEQKQSMAIQGL